MIDLETERNELRVQVDAMRHLLAGDVSWAIGYARGAAKAQANTAADRRLAEIGGRVRDALNPDEATP